MRGVLVGALLVLLLAAPAHAGARSGTIALDPASNLVNGGTVVLDATASGLHGGESILVRLWCYQGTVLTFEQDATWSPFNNNPAPTVWSFPISWGNADPVDCQAQTWYQNPDNRTHSGGTLAPLSPLIVFTAT